MFKIELFNQYGEYEERNFESKKEFIGFLKECEQNESVEVLDFTDHFDYNDD